MAGGSFSLKIFFIAPLSTLVGVLFLSSCSLQITHLANGRAILSRKSSEGTPFTLPLAFTHGTDSNYSFSGANRINLTTDAASLTLGDQTDDDNDVALGFGKGIPTGASYDSSTHVLKLSNSGLCDGTTSNCMANVVPYHYELDSGWTPKYANLVYYWKMNGASSP